MTQTYSGAAQALINSGLPDSGLVALNRGFGPVPVVNLGKLDAPNQQLLAIASAFDAEVN